MYKTYNQLNGETKSNSTKLVQIESSEHKDELLRNNPILCVDVYADWCQPCKQLEPNYAVLSKRLSSPGKCMLVKENLESQLAKGVGITVVPTFLIYYRGSLHTKIDGGDLDKVSNTVETLLQEFSAPDTSVRQVDDYAQQSYPQYTTPNFNATNTSIRRFKRDHI